MTRAVRLGVGGALVLAAAMLGARPALAQHKRASITNVSADFGTGPYTSLAVDPSDPSRVAVGTADGRVSLSNDGGRTADDTLALAPRTMDFVPIRGGSQFAFYARAQAQRFQRRNPTGPARSREPDRALLLFINLLMSGTATTRWALWMPLTNPLTDVDDVAFSVGRGPLALASQAGILVSDDSHTVWQRVLGGPGVMSKQRDLLGLSVAIDPRDSHHMLAGTDRGVMVSHDAGQTWDLHPDKDLQGAWIERLVWDPKNPQLVFAVAPDTIYLSQDGGTSFEASFSSQGDIKDLSLSPNAAVVATSKGVEVATSGGVKTLAPSLDALGAVPWRDGTFLAATSQALYWITPDGRVHELLHTSPSDPYLRLAGGGQTAWLLSASTVLRIGDPVARGRGQFGHPPRMLLTMSELERAVIQRTHLGGPEDTRVHDRWYAKLLPELEVTVGGNLWNVHQSLSDPTVLPGRVWQAVGDARGRLQFEVFARWDLTQVLLGDNNVSNPNLIIEANIRQKRDEVLRQVREHYREAAELTAELARPPADPVKELEWRMRLQEYASYLEAVSGVKVIDKTEIQEPR